MLVQSTYSSKGTMGSKSEVTDEYSESTLRSFQAAQVC